MAILRAETNIGTVLGVRGNNRGYSVFRGVPYAAAPIGELRFAPPQPHPGWEGERLCDRWPNTCIQTPGSFGHFTKEFYPEPKQMDEDCLYLNIWTPANSADEKLPVFFWMHGGAYLGGYSYEMEFDGEAMCKRGCILVTIEYRCNLFGFFAHPRLTEKWGYSGNAGMLDQIAALKWVKENISAFGGDPDNVTIHGQSAGAMSTKSLLASPLCKGLFNRAIIQSGGALNDWSGFATMAEKELAGTKLLEGAGIGFDEAMSMPADKLYDLCAPLMGRGMNLKFSPCIDNYALFESTGKALESGRIVTDSIMVGSVAGDAGFQAPQDASPDIRKLYALAPQVALGRHMVKNGRPPIYGYFFDHNLPGDTLGAWHSSELWYMFGTMSRCWRPWTGFDYELSDAMVDYWCAFAATGDPNPKDKDLPEWPAFTADTPKIMHFTDGYFASEDMVTSEAAETAVKAMSCAE